MIEILKSIFAVIIMIGLIGFALGVIALDVLLFDYVFDLEKYIKKIFPNYKSFGKLKKDFDETVEEFQIKGDDNGTVTRTNEQDS